MILDTSFLIDLMNDHADAVTCARALEGERLIQRIPAQVVYELYVGVGYTDTPEREVEKIQSVIESRPVVETSEPIARLAGRLDGHLRRDRNRIAQGDIRTGATARHFDEPVVTGNPADFEPLPGVDVRTY